MKKSNFALAIASGLLMAMALPKPGWWVASWFGLTPLFIAARKATPKKAAFIGFLCGFVYFATICRWLVIFGYLPWVLVSAKEALWLALFLAATCPFLREPLRSRRYLAVPAAWTATQWFRVFGPLGFTWGSFAHTQANVLPLIQLSALTGPWGIDFVVCAVNVALADLVLFLQHEKCKRMEYVPLVAVAAMVLVVCVYGRFLLDENAIHSNRLVKVAVVQASLTHDVNPEPEYVVEAYEKYAAMTRTAAADKPDLVLWPETTIVDCITADTWEPLLGSLARELNINLVVGGYDLSSDPQGRNYNAAHFFDRSGRRIGVYRKVHLVPYGEYVPFRKQMPWLKRYGIREIDVLPGKTHNVITTDVGKVGTVICFESLFPAVTSQEVRRGANLLIILTNDAWFKRTQAAQQHLMMAQLRAVETHRFVVRAAATGISAIIDPKGHICSQMGLFERGIVRGTVANLDATTPYVKYGDWFAYACLGALIVSVAFRRRIRIRKR
ncbi:MAG: apolipoprotein N-acyltransferase [Armatimonadota bacterium]|nr:apolipoprotein N-acyltransferase [Armatimonadota bacterium]